MTTLVRVVYGRVALLSDALAGRRCPHCNGTGTVFGDTGRSSYTYATDTPLEVGDVVMVPGNKFSTAPVAATVVALGSDYDGEPVKILRKVS